MPIVRPHTLVRITARVEQPRDLLTVRRRRCARLTLTQLPMLGAAEPVIGAALNELAAAVRALSHSASPPFLRGQIGFHSRARLPFPLRYRAAFWPLDLEIARRPCRCVGSCGPRQRDGDRGCVPVVVVPDREAEVGKFEQPSGGRVSARCRAMAASSDAQRCASWRWASRSARRRLASSSAGLMLLSRRGCARRRCPRRR